MSAFNAASILLFPSIGFVALAVGLLARRYSPAALVIGLIGLSSLAAAAAYITASGQLHPRLVESVPDKEPVPGNVSPERSDRQPDAASTAVEAATVAEIQRLERDLRTERDRRSDANRKAADLKQQLRDARQGRSAAEEKVAALVLRLAIQQAPPAKPSPPDVKAIRARLETGELPYYSTQPAEPLIPGQNGKWYVIHVLYNGQALEFADRQFVLPDAANIKASTGHLRDSVLLPLTQAGRRWRLYARGEADPRQVVGPVGSPIAYLPRQPNGTYSSQLLGKRIIIPVQNDDLPALRADWLRGVVRSVLGPVVTDDIDILENPPRQGHRRSAELVLLVDW